MSSTATAQEFAEATSIPDEAHEKARQRPTYASFGRGGVTATANAYGHLLLITQFFGNEPSGFISVDLPDTSEPYFVKNRAGDLQRQSSDPTKGIRLLFKNHGSRGEWKLNKSIPTVKYLHDRWPCFFTGTSVFDVKIQYFISNKTVYQTYTFTLRDGAKIPSQIPQLIINAGLLLRNLNFLIRDHRNERGPKDDHYSHQALDDNYCVIRLHKGSLAMQVQDAVALFITLFINGQRQQPQMPPQTCSPEDEDNYLVIPDEEALSHLSSSRTFEITLAYTLKSVSSEGIPMESSPITNDDLTTARDQINIDQFQILSFTGDEPLDFTLRRNLEHILSVCSIPINSSSNTEDPLYALTCGDISGHRVASAASFYSFQFLLSAFEYFNSLLTKDCSCEWKPCTCNGYAHIMHGRILQVCSGHIKWLCYALKWNQSISPHHWATGKEIWHWESNQSLAKQSLIDILFTIIKAADFCRIIASPEEKQGVVNELERAIILLGKHLHQSNKNNKLVFPRSMEDKLHTFYLSDHAIIWRALKCTEELGFNLEFRGNLQLGQHYTDYSSSDIRDSILDKFTVEHPHLGKPMIAVSRSLPETSFLLQVEDTTIFYAMRMGLFDTYTAVEDTNNIWQTKVDVWEATIDSQALYENNQYFFWHHPLQFALAIIVSANDKPMNSRSAANTLKYAKSTLLQSSSSNGLFPGLFNKYKEPILFDNELMRDPYWHATFEIPYILWEFVQNSPGSRGYGSTNSSGTTLPIPPTSELYSCDNVIVKKRVPHKYFTDRVDIIDHTTEWLFNKPRFFEFHIDLPDTINNEWLRKGQTIYHGMGNGKSSRIIDKAVAAVQTSHQEQQGLLGYIIDIPTSKYAKSSGKTSFSSPISLRNGLHSVINGKRDPAVAKKRILQFFLINWNIALNCYFASSENEEISSFFDKHASYSKYFFEDTTATLNKWVTELHLSFYQVAPRTQAFQTIHPPEKIKFPGPEDGEHSKWIGRAVMSFRFDGDLFDRSWTCHFFDYNPQWIAQSNTDFGWKAPIDTWKIEGSLEAQPWGQRRILELMLLDLILQEMLRGTKGILEDIMRSVAKSPQSDDSKDLDWLAAESAEIDASKLLKILELFLKADSSTFSSTNQLWNQFQRILQVIEDDLKENLATIDLWMNREERRKQLGLRWAFGKDQKYQGATSKLNLSIGHHIHELKRCLSNVTSFNLLLTRRLELMRSDLEMRNNDNVRLFTYVTVVFLPVSFATGVFSMSNAPTKEILSSMAATAGVALLVTLIALLNAKILDIELVRPIFRVSQPLSEAAIRTTLRVPHHILHVIIRYVIIGSFIKFAYLVLLPLLLILPSNCIYFLTRYLYLPINQKLSQEKRTSEQKPSSQAYVIAIPFYGLRIAQPVNEACIDFQFEQTVKAKEKERIRMEREARKENESDWDEKMKRWDKKAWKGSQNGIREERIKMLENKLQGRLEKQREAQKREQRYKKMLKIKVQQIKDLFKIPRDTEQEISPNNLEAGGNQLPNSSVLS